MSSLSVYTRRDPFREFDALIRNAFGPLESRPANGIAFTPAAETVRDGDDAVVRLELPGVDVANDIDVEVTPGRLVVRGERRDERSEASEGRHLREIRYGRFERSFGLPGHVTADAVTASYDAGVLSVRIAGVYAGTQPTRIAVTGPVAVEPAQPAPAEEDSAQNAG
ncbi:MAG TPA: Hsp20/alpha crystallin family protein [Marmoricola sp.]|jgi:HSP20 family protein|nr:Hsp20/alpha crystallin family protein [Marmoricola sp.]